MLSLDAISAALAAIMSGSSIGCHTHTALAAIMIKDLHHAQGPGEPPIPFPKSPFVVPSPNHAQGSSHL